MEDGRGECMYRDIHICANLESPLHFKFVVSLRSCPNRHVSLADGPVPHVLGTCCRADNLEAGCEVGRRP